ncbi:MAG: phosphoheptose isomerase [Pelagibacterales bacterium MED-G44]|nr:MAG: phosphoheptose isomerase [Pelagibacterales bacterium MED-G44]
MQLKKDINSNLITIKNLLNLNKEINQAISLIYRTIRGGNKVYICGNGGSAGEAQHLAAEFLVRLNPNKNRKAYPVISLAMDTSTLTACGNDFNFKYIFSRNLEALGVKKDLLITLSTSGNSQNIIEVLKVARKKKISSLSFLGFNGGKAKKYSNLNLVVASTNVARIQEAHLFLGHFILNEVEKKLIN